MLMRMEMTSWAGSSDDVNVNVTVNDNVDVNVDVSTDGDDNVGWRLRCFHSRPIGHRKLHTPLTEDPQLLLMITTEMQRYQSFLLIVIRNSLQYYESKSQ